MAMTLEEALGELEEIENRSCGSQGAQGIRSDAGASNKEDEPEDGDGDSDRDGDGDAMTVASGLTHISGDSKKCRYPGLVTWADTRLDDGDQWDDEYQCEEQQVPHAAVAEGSEDADADGPHAAVAVAGNIGFTFGNWGARAKDQDLQDRIDLQIKRSPAAILGLTEAQIYHAEILRAPATKGNPEAEMKLLRRDGYKWLVVRGVADEAPLIAVRDTVGQSIDLIYQENKFEGKYSGKGTKKYDAYTKILCCDCYLKFPVPFFGSKVRILNVHLHPHVANNNKGFRLRQQAISSWLPKLIKDFDVDILMGDFNMWLWKLIPQLRDKDVVINLLAWFPWKTKEDGIAMCDSCGIFLCKHVTYSTKLHKGIDTLNHGPTGFFFHGKGVEGYNYIEKNAGPGQKFDAYLPKAADFYEKLVESFIIRPTPSTEGVAFSGNGGKVQTRKDTLNFQERRLDLDAWLVDGINYKGSHFPIACFMNSYCRRSPEKHRQRWANSSRWKGRGKGVQSQQAAVAVQNQDNQKGWNPTKGRYWTSYSGPPSNSSATYWGSSSSSQQWQGAPWPSANRGSGSGGVWQ